MSPLRLDPGVNADHEPFLRLCLDGTPIGQWTLAAARAHALHALEAIIAADLDAAYYRILTGRIDLAEDTARAAVGGLTR